MKLSEKTIYGIRACAELYGCNDRIGLDGLVKKLGCNRSLLNKVLYELVAGGLLSSKKGPGGGFRLENNGVTCLEIAQVLGEKIGAPGETQGTVGIITDFLPETLDIKISSLALAGKEVYLDYAATTPLDRRVLGKMMQFYLCEYGNANSVHAFGRDAAAAVDEARRLVSGIIGCEKKEMFFTSGGSEGNNWIIKEASRAIKEKTGRNEILVSALEHPSVYESAVSMTKEGFVVKVIPSDGNGTILKESLEALLGGNTALVSVMTANNETGAMQNIKELVLLAHSHGAYFHTDAVQALGCTEINVKDTGTDYMTFSSHKFYGPKGVGGAYIKSGVPVFSLISGGHQERSRRGGTSNVPGIVGMAEALRITRENLAEENERIAGLRDYFEKAVLHRYAFAKINGNRTERIPSCLSITFSGYRADALLDRLDMLGVAASAGAACSSGSVEPSRVLGAIGLTDEDAKSTIRFSLGRYTTKEEIDFVINAVGSCLNT